MPLFTVCFECTFIVSKRLFVDGSSRIIITCCCCCCCALTELRFYSTFLQHQNSWSMFLQLLFPCRTSHRLDVYLMCEENFYSTTKTLSAHMTTSWQQSLEMAESFCSCSSKLGRTVINSYAFWITRSYSVQFIKTTSVEDAGLLIIVFQCENIFVFFITYR